MVAAERKQKRSPYCAVHSVAKWNK